MYKVAFYLDNDSLDYLDYSNPQKGNMGIGGTEYMIITLSYYLAIRYKDFNITIYAVKDGKFAKHINFVKVNNIVHAIEKAKSNKEIFIFRVPFREKSIYEYIELAQVKSITWSHNYEDSQTLKYISENNFIKAHVCVGKEQFDRLIDHKIIKKTTYIYNSVNFDIYNINKTNKNKNKKICFVGAIDEIKGFHKVAEIFNILESEFENIELHIIGGDLYKNQINSKYGICDEVYEEKFIKFITDENFIIKKNVKFWGVKAEKEKLEIMASCDIGIVNPTGQSETFCLVALEFQAVGVPVISIKKYGLVDVIDDKKYGFLVNKSDEIIEKSRAVLNGDVKCNKNNKYYNKKFDIENNVKIWAELLINIDKNKNINNYINIKEISNKRLDYKWIRIINYNIKNKFSIESPSLIEYRKKISNMKKIFGKKKRV